MNVTHLPSILIKGAKRIPGRNDISEAKLVIDGWEHELMFPLKEYMELVDIHPLHGQVVALFDTLFDFVSCADTAYFNYSLDYHKAGPLYKIDEFHPFTEGLFTADMVDVIARGGVDYVRVIHPGNSYISHLNKKVLSATLYSVYHRDDESRQYICDGKIFPDRLSAEKFVHSRECTEA